MAGLDLPTAQAKLALWLGAEEKVALGQSVTYEGRQLTRANLAEIGERVAYWDRKCKELARGRGVCVQRAVLRD